MASPDDVEVVEEFLSELEAGETSAEMIDAPMGRKFGVSAGVRRYDEAVEDGVSLAAGRFNRSYGGLVEALDRGELDALEDVPVEGRSSFVEVCTHVGGLGVSEEELRAACDGGK
ncbi:hypothetical protein ACLI4R_17505 [Natrialbaceae archaeon A-chndr2]